MDQHTPHTIDLQQYQIIRPDRVTWTAVVEGENYIESLRSKSLKKFLRNLEEVLNAHSITYELRSVTAEQFSEWLSFYEAEMEDRSYRVIANQEWYEKRTSQGKMIEGLFLLQHGELIGAGIISRDAKEKASLAFKASKKISISSLSNGNLGSVLDYLFITQMHQLGVQEISGGISRNAFGVLNTMGYLEYKTKFYTPSSAQTAEETQEVPLTPEGDVLFYGYAKQSPNEIILFYVKPRDFERPNLNPQMFVSKQVPFQVIEYTHDA